MDVQTENGYLKIANDLWDSLNRICLSDGERRVLGVVIRKTYGFNKKDDKISLTQFCKDTGISRQCVIKSIKSLVNRRLLARQQALTRQIITYGILKDYEKWMPRQQPLPRQQALTRPSQRSNKSLVNARCPTKDIYTKDNIKTGAFTYLQNDVFSKTFTDYLEMRTKKKKPATDRAKELVLKELHKNTQDIAIKMLEQSIVNSWTDVYPVKNNGSTGAPGWANPAGEGRL